MTKIVYDRGFAERLVTQKKENEVLHKKTLEYKQNMHEKQKTFADNLKEQEMKRKPFNAKINQMSMANATATRLRREGRNPGETLEYMIDGHQD
jgi:AAA15 family ATPase/GTPase